MQSIVDFFDQLFTVLGYLTTLLVMLGAIYTIYLIAKGVIPVWIRLGMGLSKRKIAVFAEGDEFDSLKSTLVDSGIFLKSNVVKIDKNSLNKAEDMTLFLVHWNSFKSEIDDILEKKKHYAAMVIYAPQSEGFIDEDTMEKINKRSNTTIVNFRGRLLNDILVSMITTSYKTK